MTQIAEAFVRVRAVADVASFQRSTKEVVKGNEAVSKSLRQTEQDFGRFSRGAAVGSGALRGIGRSAAFASASFLGAYGFVSVLRTSIQTAEHFEKAARGLDAQLKATGLSSESAAPLIAKTNAQMANLGITADQSEEALGRLIRATGNVSRATKLMGLTADLAAARHIGLSQAALIVGKVVQGTVTAFNRFGIVIKSGTSVTDALRIAQEKLAGQAQATVTPMERLHASVTNLEAAVGTQLLPTVNKIADSLNAWLSSSKNQAVIQRDVAQAVKDGTAAIHGLAGALSTAKAILDPMVSALGGLKNTVELLIALKAALWAKTFATELGILGTTATVAGPQVATAETEIAAAGGAADVAAGKVGRLRGALTSLGAIGAITLTVDLIERKHFGLSGTGGTPGTAIPGTGGSLFFPFPDNYNPLGRPSLGTDNGLSAASLLDSLGKKAAVSAASTDPFADARARRLPSATATRDQATATALALATTRKQITAAVNARLAFVNDTIAFARKLISQGRGNTKQLETTLQALGGERKSDQGILDQFAADDAAAAKAAADKAAAAAKKAAEAAKARAAKAEAAEKARQKIVNAGNKKRLDQLAQNLADGQAYTHSFIAGLGKIAAENRKAAAARAANAAEATLVGLQNVFGEAELIRDPAKRLAAEKTADQVLVKYYEGIVARLKKQKAGILAIRRAESDVISARLALQSLTASKASSSGFTLGQLFAEAGSEFATYGSNIGTDLSPQDARGAFAGAVKTHQTTVVQNFYGARPTGQALADARAVARNSK